MAARTPGEILVITRETAPLLPNVTNNENGTQVTVVTCEKRIGGLFHGFFHLFCFLSGQLMFDCKRNNLSRCKYALRVSVNVVEVPFFILFFLLNIGSLLFDLYAIFKCPFPNCGFIAGPYIESKAFFNINLNADQFPIKTRQYLDLQKAVITMATVSGSLSYLIMTYVLIVNYSYLRKPIASLKTAVFSQIIKGCNFEKENADEYKRSHQNLPTLLHPFLNGKEDHHEDAHHDYKPVFLYAKQLFCFYFIFFLNFSLFVSNVGTLFVIVHIEDDTNYPKWEIIDYFGLAAQMSSQYCAIISCFIFSKVAYAVTIRCHEMLENYNSIVHATPPAHPDAATPPAHPDATTLPADPDAATPPAHPDAATLPADPDAATLPADPDAATPPAHPDAATHPAHPNAATPPADPAFPTDPVILRRLERADEQYVDMCNDSMRPYRFWFAVHWVSYAITAFMSIAYFAETIIEHIYSTYEHNCWHSRMCNLSIIYIFLFTLEHIVLFLYPCFRAASILDARNTLIHKVSRQRWPADVKFKFLQFMKEQKCGFILSLLCAKVEFGFNIAYISVFVGLLGIIIKLSL